jgi:hypothetical protein
MTNVQQATDTLSARQQAIPLIAAFMAASDMPKLHAALNQGLDAGLTLSEAKEILVQLYAYVGFPKSLNALGELLKVVQARQQRGIQDAPGREPSRAIPTGDALVAAGKANQTMISGGPVQGLVFDFAPVINQFLQAHRLSHRSGQRAARSRALPGGGRAHALRAVRRAGQGQPLLRRTRLHLGAGPRTRAGQVGRRSPVSFAA